MRAFASFGELGLGIVFVVFVLSYLQSVLRARHLHESPCADRVIWR